MALKPLLTTWIELNLPKPVDLDVPNEGWRTQRDQHGYVILVDPFTHRFNPFHQDQSKPSAKPSALCDLMKGFEVLQDAKDACEDHYRRSTGRRPFRG